MVPPVYVFHFFFFFFFMFSEHVLLLSCAARDQGESYSCPPSFPCGNLGSLQFPFTTPQRKDCGVLAIQGCDDHNHNANKTVQFKNGGREQLPLLVKNIYQQHHETAVYVIHQDLKKRLANGNCEAFSYDITVPPSSALGYFQITHNITLYKCNHTLKVPPPKQFLNYTGCANHTNVTIYFGTENTQDSPPSLAACSRVQLPVNDLAFSGDPFTFIAAEFPIQVLVSDECYRCFGGGGQCRLKQNGPIYCSPSKGDDRRKLALILGIGLIVPSMLVLVLLLGFRYYKQKSALSHVRLRSTNERGDPDPDSGRLFFGVSIFSYKELQEATSDFHPSRKLGDGGFGSVYYGKLQDGREVAVKLLFNQNYRRVEQFMNEVEILTRLRHSNLLSLYGCTSRQSRELLLVYEYVQNGTVASHLRGDTANPALLTWPIRLRIAVETASALAYLHASDIIHRDVKTDNLLLDKNFTVKVADFGLSRLFPNDVSHVSTAPQGTPGYLDPEYHCCFQLTNKSDVYSFGVVLIELISCMPAVDIGREREEIALGNLAVRKIQRGELEDLVDPCLGIEKDSEVKRMVVSVGELAFQCLQMDKELRPSIDKVLEVLKGIESGGKDAGEGDGGGDGNPGPVGTLKWDQVRMLKKMKSPSSPNSVTEKWESDCTTPNVSV